METLSGQVLKFAGKARAKHLSDASFFGKLLVLPANIRLDWKVIARHKHSSLFALIVSNEGKKFYNIDTWTSGHVFPLVFSRLDGHRYSERFESSIDFVADDEISGAGVESFGLEHDLQVGRQHLTLNNDVEKVTDANVGDAATKKGVIHGLYYKYVMMIRSDDPK